MRRFAVLLLISMSASGCASNPSIQATSRLSVVSGDNVLPAPERGDLTASNRLALIGPLDTISINVFGVAELSREIQVDAGGRISLPLIGTLDAGGMTSRELADNIKAALTGRYVRNPDVSVNINSSVSQVVTVDGQVAEPGLYPVTNQMTLLRAIASAKGLTEFAKQDDVVILRTVNGQKMAGLYNISAIRRGSYDDPSIFANDVIVVGDSPQRRLFRDIIGVAPLLAAPIVALLQ